MTLLVLIALAAAQPRPDAVALLSADGRFTLTLIPDVGWKSAEVEVAGATFDLGPIRADHPVDVEGWTADPGVLPVIVQAVIDDNHGVQWELQVEPILVPIEVPVGDAQPVRRKPWWWPFR